MCVCHLPGLEAQLLGIVVRKERPELEEQKDNLVINIAAGKKKLEDLEDQILRYFSNKIGHLICKVTNLYIHPGTSKKTDSIIN